MSKDLALTHNQGLQLPAADEWRTIAEMGEALMASGLLPQHIKNKNQAVAIILKGRELNVQPWTALTKIHVIDGVPTVAPELMLALVYRSGLMEDITIDDPEKIMQNQKCEVTIKRVGKSAYTTSFSWDDAERQKLTGKYNWKNMPQIMMKWRAVSDAIRTEFPDVVSGMYTPEEIAPDATVNEEGVIVHEEPARNERPSPPHDEPQDATIIDEAEEIPYEQGPPPDESTRGPKVFAAEEIAAHIESRANQYHEEDGTNMVIVGDNLEYTRPLGIHLNNAIKAVTGNLKDGDGKRWAIIEYIYPDAHLLGDDGMPTTKLLTRGQVSALLDWLTKQGREAAIEQEINHILLASGYYSEQ